MMDLGSDEREHYDRLMAHHVRQTTPRAGDEELIAMAARALALCDRCRAQVARDGLVVQGRHGMVPHPSLMTMQKAENAALRALAGLGWTGRKRMAPDIGVGASDPYFGDRRNERVD